ncbi:MAG: BamA/TamA family outer membrane protein [Candidatus Eisenbacteria bacterium]|nr:BamA/TamA family outer membrane protein [Candidatus Eisenbacteria bacterium]
MTRPVPDMRARRLRAGRRAKARALGFLLVVLLSSLAPRQAGAADSKAGYEENVPRIESIDFPGAKGISAGRLRDVMWLQQKSWARPFQANRYYGPDHLERDLERVLALYREEGYVFARVDEVVVRYLAPDRVALEIRVSEGPLVHLKNLSVEGASDPLRKRLEKELTMEAGDPLSELRLQTEETRLVRLCQEEGHALAAVNREVRYRGDSADVRLWVDEGPRVRIDHIRVTGAEDVDSTVIVRETGVRPGTLLRRSRMLTAQERLFDLGLFRSVRLLPQYPDSATLAAAPREVGATLLVAVSERPAGWITVGGGVSSSEQVKLTAEWGYRNLFGRAHALLLRGELAYSTEGKPSGVKGIKERKIEASYTRPSLFGQRLRGQVNPYYRFLREPTFDEDIYGVLLGASRPLGRYERVAASFENKWVSTGDSTAGKSDYQTRFLSLAWIGDHRDFPVDPKRGDMLQARTEYAGGFLGGSASFTRWTAGAAYYVPLGRRLLWALRTQVGYIRPIGRGVGVVGEERDLLRVPFNDRFRAGGGTTVRGYDEKSLGPQTADGQPLGGLALMLLNAEARLPLFWQLGAAVFVDAGNVWEDYRSIGWNAFAEGWSGDYSERNVAYSTGIGLRWQTPVGPVRLDYGFKVNGHRRPGTDSGAWHFSLGQAF